MNSYLIHYALWICGMSICLSANLSAQEQLISPDQRALGGIQSYSSSPHLLHTNPALLHGQDGQKYLTAHGENRYFSAIQRVTMGYSSIHTLQGWRISLSDYGITGWRENHAQLSYGRLLTDHLSIGTTVSYQRIDLREYGSQGQFNIDLGLGIQPTDAIHLSLMAQSIAGDELSAPLTLIAGSRIHTTSKTDLYVEYQHSPDALRDDQLSIGLSYSAHEDLQINLGINTLSAGPSVGISYRVLDQLSISAAISHHSQLGGSGALGVSYGW